MLPLLPHLKLPKRRPLPEPTTELRVLADELRRDIAILALDIGERHTRRPKALHLAEDFCASALGKAGYEVKRYPYQAHGVECRNIEATLPGTTHPERIIVVGAHYDSVYGCPAANDNGSGIAGTLAIARRLAKTPLACSVRFVCFANEEPPHFREDTMGSLVYSRMCRARGDDIRAMFTLETIGCYKHEAGSQRWPPSPFTKYLTRVGDFILVIGNSPSAKAVKVAGRAFRKRTRFPIMSAALPQAMGELGWSDHWSFQIAGYPAFMVTDTAPFRYAHYHRATDTPEKLDYVSMARVVDGMQAATEALATK